MLTTPQILAGIAVVLCGSFCLWRVYRRTPSHEGTWELGQQVLPYIEQVGTTITISNLRDYQWTSPSSAEVRYVERSFDHSSIRTVDLVVSHFSRFRAVAHTFLRFGLADGTRICVSLEARRHEGQSFSPLKGMFRTFHVVWVLATERDMIGVRTDFRNEEVYVFETHASPALAQNLFATIARDVNDLYARPRFYHTFAHSCVTELTRHLSVAGRIRLPWSYALLLPGYYPRLLHAAGLLAGDVPYHELRRNARVHTVTRTHTPQDGVVYHTTHDPR